MPFNSKTGRAASYAAKRKNKKSFQQRLWLGISVRGKDECWEWSGATNGVDGHGVIRLTNCKKNAMTHRAVFEELHGPIPDGQIVCHRCDNPPCCNPNHLFLGSQADNMRDCSKKERIFKMKLTASDVEEMKKMRLAGCTYQSIADAFGVYITTAHRAIRGQTWKHVH